LARLVDVSASLISQIETGKSSPSVSTLYAMTAALDISVEDVFGDVGERAARAALAAQAATNGGAAGTAGTGTPAGALPRADGADTGPGADRSGSSAATQGLRQLQRNRRVGPVVKAGEREMLRLDSGVTWELLGQLPDTHVDFLRITYAPGGSSSGAGVLMRHSGTEWGHMLSGQLTLTLGFDQYVLNPGDSVSFDCSTPHSYANHGIEPAIGVWYVAERFR
jgi:DNA-binding XRE family transcriptional regulator/quercetin dioxygenase-like cupin family protein